MPIKFIVSDPLNVREFDIEKYRGQEYDGHKYALTVAVVEDTCEVYLVPIEKDPQLVQMQCDDTSRVCVEELHNYLDACYGQDGWSQTHTLRKDLDGFHEDFKNPF